MSLHVIEPEADKFGNSKSGSKAHVEHGSIASPSLGGWIGSIKEGSQLFGGEITDQSVVSLLGGDRQDTTDLFDGGGDPILNEVCEGLYGGETGVPRSRRIGADGLDVF